ncbi:MAG TPA: N-acetyltransferase [Deltaproteobacteria bacterium]|nr:N-acetyltransferase [Deltaproteobacteria bacterium]HCP47393.1 N-acetyltransferase [Deltaproteobacteria bacterium]
MSSDPFIHASSYVDDGASIGVGTRIWFFCHVQTGATIGRDCILGQNVNIDRGVVVGDRVKIQNNVSVYNGVVIEDDVFLGPSCVFTNVINPRAFVERKTEFRPTRVCRGATVGANATVVCGHDVGEYAMVGAGAVVTRSVAPHALVLGMPARRVGWVCRCGDRLDFAGRSETECRSCDDRYASLGPEAIQRVDDAEAPSVASMGEDQ